MRTQKDTPHTRGRVCARTHTHAHANKQQGILMGTI